MLSDNLLKLPISTNCVDWRQKGESGFIVFLHLAFIAGTIIFLIKFHEQRSPNFYALGIFLLVILLLLIFYDKIDEIGLSKEGVVLKMKRVTGKFLEVRAEDKEKGILKKAYSLEEVFKEGV